LRRVDWFELFMTLNVTSDSQFQILPELRRIQGRYGYLNRDELKRFSRESGIPLYQLQEVASFFPHLRLSPPPAVTVSVCRDMACHLAGATSALEQLASEGVSVEGVSCLGRCDRAPAVRISLNQTVNQTPKQTVNRVPGSGTAGNSQVHEFYCLGRETGEIKRMVSACLDGRASSIGADRDIGRPEYPSRNWLIDPYKGTGGEYAGVKKLAAAPQKIDQVFIELDDAGLRGFGGAGVPASQKWRDVRDSVAEARRRRTDDRAFIVVNGDESEPGTFKDRELLLHFPHLVLEGVILAGLVTGASEGFIFIRHEYPEQIAACEAEIRRAVAMGVCGATSRILGRPFPISVFVSPGGYICGEQSALIEAMSGRRAEPRNLPPKLETNGLRDRPTLVSNVETLAWIPYVLINGGKKYASLGVNGRKGRRFFSVCGDVERPGVYEVPMGLTLRALVFGSEYCQGIAGSGKLKAIAPSGPSGGFLPATLSANGGLPRNHTALREWQDLASRRGWNPEARELNILDLELELDLFRALSPTQMLGGGIVVYAEGRDMADQAVNALEFFRNESCGKCVPCRVGSQKLANLGSSLIADCIHEATWKDELAPLVAELSDVMVLSSICGLGRSVPMPLRTLIDYFGQDLARHLR
jgi:NADH:ubiquinone oxidoreductase subunit F (NADH-binding)/NADH:ubiquinone oxidoreductase subunit E